MISIIPSTVVIVPALNAERSLSELINRLRRSVGEIRVLIVDDGSNDKTSEIATSMGAIVVRHEVNRGKGAALQTGFDYVKRIPDVDFVLTMDADIQHCPEDVPAFFATQQSSNADIVVGWRKRIGKGMPFHRILSNTITSVLVGVKTGRKIKDSQCGFRLIKRRVIESVQLESSGFEAETEFLIKSVRQGFQIEFVPISTVYGNERSFMTHWTTTVNFVKVLFRDYA
jgi:glycosyltransferase involved in cell wall biosynthesis